MRNTEGPDAARQSTWTETVESLNFEQKSVAGLRKLDEKSLHTVMSPLLIQAMLFLIKG